VYLNPEYVQNMNLNFFFDKPGAADKGQQERV